MEYNEKESTAIDEIERNLCILLDYGKLTVEDVTEVIDTIYSLIENKK